MIGVVDIGIGNSGSVTKALRLLEADHKVAKSPEDLEAARKIILPGVGSFKEGSTRLKDSGFFDCLRAHVLDRKKPILGICLGMQLFADWGHEHGGAEGLGLVKGEVVPIDPEQSGTKSTVHMGWNDVEFSPDDPTFDGIAPDECFYFVHGYHFVVPASAAAVSTVDFGKKMTASVNRENIWGTQFHPEKSQKPGIQVLKNFCESC